MTKDLMSELLTRLRSGELSIPSVSEEERLLAACEHYNNSVGTLTGYDCELCKNRGYVMVIKESGISRVTAMRECSCKEARRSRRRMEESGLGELLERYTFENYKVTNKWQQGIKAGAMSFLQDKFGKWFYIGGQVGSGKTHLCTAIVGELLRRGRSARYMMWRDDSVRLKAMVTDSQEYSAIMEPLKQTEVLYIDDFFKGGGRPTGPDISLAFELLGYRYYRAGLVTIISSEFPFEDIKNFDEGLGSRIGERTTDAYRLCVGVGEGRNYRLR